MRKNNITLNFKNIISFLNNLTGHFTEKEKIIILSLAILMLSFVNIIFNTNSISALSYQSEVGIGFTFNPTLSVSLSSSDLVISNLTPGSSSDSNSININVTTNNAYGYSLYASAGNEEYNNTNLTHTDESGIFSSIDINANLTNLTTNNTWGYSYSLNDGSTWSNYNGLPLYSSNTLKRLARNTEPANDTINFKISAKSGTTQPSGTYSNVVNFSAVATISPITLAEAYASEGKELYHGYYKMQDMTSTICEKTEDINAQLQVIDIRDNKIYWISKLADDHCWMTQNLDLDLNSDPTAENYIALTSENTDLTNATITAYKDGYTTESGIITWLPERSTITYNELNSTTWQDDANNPYSYDYLDNNGSPVYPDNSATQQIAGSHGLSGNYYNWSAAIASNSSGSLGYNYAQANNSICPKNWRLPIAINASNTIYEFGSLLLAQGVIDNIQNPSYTTNGFNKIISSPLYFIRAGYVYNSRLWDNSGGGYYWPNVTGGGSSSYGLVFGSTDIQPKRYIYRHFGVSVRCLAK